MTIYILTSGEYSDYGIDSLIETDGPLDIDTLRQEWLDVVRNSAAPQSEADFQGWLLQRPGVREIEAFELWGAGWKSTRMYENLGPRYDEENGVLRAIDDEKHVYARLYCRPYGPRPDAGLRPAAPDEEL